MRGCVPLARQERYDPLGDRMLYDIAREVGIRVSLTRLRTRSLKV